MLKKTHRMIVSHLYQILDSKDKALISKKALIDGSTYPDRHVKYRMIHHGYDTTIHFVLGFIKDILSRKQNRFEFGHKLGIITHFIVDYTTAYHSNPHFRQKVLSHFSYEKTIHKLFNFQDMDSSGVTVKSLDSIEDDLMAYIKTYHQSKYAHPSLDMMHATSLTKSITDLILEKYQEIYKQVHRKDFATRVAIFSDTYFPHINGVSNTLFHMMQYYEKNGIPYVLVSPKYKEVSQEKELGFHMYKVKGVPFLYYPQTMMSIPNKRKLNDMLNEFKPTIIHAITEFNLGYYGLSYAKRNNIPIVSNYSTHFHLGLKHMKLEFARKPLARYLKWFHNAANVTTTPSYDTMHYLHEFGIPKVSIFSRGIDTNQFNPNKRDDDLRRSWDAIDKKVLLYVGRVSGEKSLLTLLKSYQKLDPIIKAQTRLVIAGDGPLLPDIRKNYPDVIATGFRVGEDLHKIYASADLFVFPSTSETLGNVVLEAMASGLPVIGVAEGGVKQNLINHFNGLMVDKDHVDLFHHAIETVLNNEKLYLKLKQQAYQYAIRKSWNQEFISLLTIYDKLILASKEGAGVEVFASGFKALVTITQNHQ